VKNQIKSLLNLHGINWDRTLGSRWTKRYMQWLDDLEFDQDNLRYTLEQYLDEYRFIQAQVDRVTDRLKELSMHSAYKSNYNRITACKGVGFITAMTYLLELGEVLRFSSAAKFVAYLGMTPSQHSSGEHVRLGHITREGNSHIRKVLVESAWTVIRYDPLLRDKYNRIVAKGTNGKKAIVAVARSLAIRLRRCIIDEVVYDMSICK